MAKIKIKGHNNFIEIDNKEAKSIREILAIYKISKRFCCFYTKVS